MTAWPVSFVRIDNEVRGPLTPDQLRELAEASTITPETEAATDAAGPWMRFCEIPDCIELFPERPQYKFKAALFEQVNRPDAPPVDHQDLIAAANRPPPSIPGRSPPPAAAANQVLEILKFNRECEKRAGLDQLSAQPPRSNRRLLDYWILFALGNGFFGTALWLGWGNASVMVYSISGVALFTGGLTWVMYGVMDRY